MKKLLFILSIFIGFNCYSQIKVWGVNSQGIYAATDITPIPNYQSVKRTVDTTCLLTSLANIGGMTFPLVAGQQYSYKYVLIYSTAATTTGVRLSLVFPTATTQSALVTIHGLAADGAASEWSGTINSSGDIVTSTAVAVINVNYIAIIEGTILPSANGILILQFASEVAAAATLKRGSVGHIWSY